MNVNGASIKVMARGEGPGISTLAADLASRSGGGRQGSALSDIVGRSSASDDSFRKRYEEVVRSNDGAHRAVLRESEPQRQREWAPRARAAAQRLQPYADQEASGRPYERSETILTAGEGAEACTASCGDAAPAAGPEGEEPIVTDEQGTATAASQAVGESLLIVSRELNLTVSEGLYNLDLKNANEGTVERLAEILASLKGILGVVEDHLKAQTPLDVNGKAFELQELASLDKTLRQQVFRIEYALIPLGVAQEVNEQVLAKMDLPGQGGLAQAMDPATRSMPALHLRQLFGADKGTAGEADPGTLLERLAAALRKAQGEGATTSSMTAFVSKTATAENATATLRTLGVLEPRALHTMLKVDAANATAAQNQEAAAQNGTMDLPNPTTVSFGKNLSGQAVRQGDLQRDVLPLTAAATKADASVLLAARTVHVTTAPETSVVNQLVEKFNHVLKTGAHDIRIMLKPESLGEVRLRVQMDGDIVITRIQVESQQVKQIIESNLSNLKNALAEHNLQAGAFSVDVGGGAAGGQADHSHGSAAPAAAARETGTDAGTEEAPEGAHAPAVGAETGRRFGSNSVEYYA